MRKKLFTLLLAVAASVGTMFASTKIGNLYYNLDATNHTAVVAENSSASGEIIIPSSVTTYNSVSYSVTSIGYYAFRFCSGLTSVTIPNSVTSIGEGAFYYCSGLTSVTIPNSVTSIGEGAFNYCTGLTSVIVENGNTIYDSRDNCNAIIETATNTLIAGCKNTTIPNSVTSIGYDAFDGCTSLTSVTIPNSVTSIGYAAFRGCSGLTSVTIPNSVTSIGVEAFYGCYGLTSITISNSVKSIGDGAFGECTGLTSVTIPNSVTSIGFAAFGECTDLTSVIVENGNTIYDSRDNCNAIIETATNTLIAGCKNTTIPNSVKSIGDGAFGECTGLTSVTIPNSVTSIGYAAFAYCSGLTSVTIPNSVTSIGEYAFKKCTGLTSIICKAVDLPTLGDEVFGDVPKNIPLYVPDGKESAYNDADQWKEFDIKPISAIPTGIEQAKSQEPIANSQKLLINGQLIILRDGKMYNAQGAEVR